MEQPPFQSLADTRDALLSLPHPFTRDAVHSVVRGLRPHAEELDPYRRFSETGYTRVLFYRGPRLEILVMCWLAGQRSPIHDHASSLCSMAVVEGTCRAEGFWIPDGRLPFEIPPGTCAPVEMTRSTDCEPGQVVTLMGQDVHRISNPREDDSRLVTVHFYLPAIESARCFEEETGRCRIIQPETLIPFE